nr:hypothetical protein [uncultured Rhodopila sp.]
MAGVAERSSAVKAKRRALNRLKLLYLGMIRHAGRFGGRCRHFDLPPWRNIRDIAELRMDLYQDTVEDAVEIGSFALKTMGLATQGGITPLRSKV